MSRAHRCVLSSFETVFSALVWAALVVLPDSELRAEHNIVVLTPHPTTIKHAAFSRDGNWLATGDLNGNVHVSDTKTGALTYTLRHHRGLHGVVFGPEGKRLWTCADDSPDGKPGNVRLWDLRTGDLVARFNAGFYGKGLVFSPDDQFLLVCGETGGTIYTIDRSGNVRELMKDGLAVAADGSLMYRLRDGVLQWRAMSALSKPAVTVDMAGLFFSVHCCPAARKFVLVKRDATTPISPPLLTLFDMDQKRESEPIVLGFDNFSVTAVTPDARYAVVSTQLPRTNFAKLSLWDLVQQKEIAEIAGAELRGWSGAAFSRDQRQLAILGYSAGSNPASARIWDLAGLLPTAGEPVRTWTSANKKFQVHARLIRSMEGNVILVREGDGRQIVVPLSKLSAADRAYVQNAAKE